MVPGKFNPFYCVLVVTAAVLVSMPATFVPKQGQATREATNDHVVSVGLAAPATRLEYRGQFRKSPNMAFACRGASDELCAPDISSKSSRSSSAMERTVGHWDSCGHQPPMTSAQRAIAWNASCASSAVGGTAAPSQAVSNGKEDNPEGPEAVDRISVLPAGLRGLS